MVSGVGAVGSGPSYVSDELRIRYAALNRSLRLKRLGGTEAVQSVPKISFAEILSSKIAELQQKPSPVSYEPIEREPISLAYKRFMAHL